MYIGKHELNYLIGKDLSKSVWSFLSRQLNHSKQIRADYDIVCRGNVHNRYVMVKGYDIDTIINTITDHASTHPDSKSIWIKEVHLIKSKLLEFKSEKEALSEKSIKEV